jgi:isopenicillin-N N-acyltransferase-like protein
MTNFRQCATAASEQSAPVPLRYREIEVYGVPRQLGRQLGEAAREEIRGFCEIALSRVQRTVRVRRTSAMNIARRCIPIVASYSPHMLEELLGVAEGARVSLDDLMLLQVRNQLQSEDVFAALSADAGCTSLALAAAAVEGDTAGGLVAQNWDNDSALDPFTVVLTRRPEGKPALTTLTQAGLIAYIGFNSAGIGLCLNTLPAPQRPLGVPHYFTVRGILESSSLDEAAQAVRRAERAIPANIMLATPQGPADLEVTLDGVRVLRDEGTGRVTHTNHCLHPELACVNEQFPELIQSVPRKRRIDALLGGSGRVSLDQVKAALRDHDGHPRSICRHTNDDAGTGFWQTVFSVIIEPAARQMHVTRGAPCKREYETYAMG